MDELIKKIKQYVQEVVQQEKGKKGDDHDYSHGKFAVAAVVERMIEEHEPTPPTVRPMSELPEEKQKIIALLEYGDGIRNWEDGISNNACVLLDKGGCYFASRKYTKAFGERLLGWLPKQVLPNPNDIKL